RRSRARGGTLPRALAGLAGQEQILLAALREPVRKALRERLAQAVEELRVPGPREAPDPLDRRDVAVELLGAELEGGAQHDRGRRFELRAGEGIHLVHAQLLEVGRCGGARTPEHL